MGRSLAFARSPHTLIFGTVFLDLIGFGIVIPVLPLYAERFGATPLAAGCLLAVYSAMQFLFAPILGRLSDRVGRRPVLLVSVIGTAAGFLLMGLANTLWLLFVARAIDGITGGNISTAQAYIADITPEERRSRGMGLIGAAFGLGFIVGPAIGGLLSHISLGAPFIFAAALAAANALAIYFLLPESLPPERRHEARERASIAAVFQQANRRRLGMILAVYFFTTAAFSLLTATYALFTERRFGFTAAQNGFIFAGQGLVGAVIQGGLLGALVSALGEKKLVIAGTVILTLTLFLLSGSATSAALLAVTTGMGIGHSLVMAPLNGVASKSVGAASQGRVLGLMQSSASLARIVGPVLGGWLLNYDALHAADAFGRSPYSAGAVIAALAVVCALAL
ncbi:MAG: MFS transporter [Candidatus Omnitrophica bacterium]|nr:MFS transporter [Candidatus Omnitrophota bacterium]